VRRPWRWWLRRACRWKREGCRGNGKRWRVRYLDPDGKERSRSFDRKADADRFKDTTAADVHRGTYMDPGAGKVTLSRYSADWLEMQTQHQASTRESIEQRLRVHILPVLGGCTLGQLASRPSLVQSWVKGLPASGNHAKAIYTTLATVLNAAVADRLIPSNPCHEANVKRTRPKPASRKIVPWTAGQVEAVREALPAPYRALMDLGAGLGLRQGEILGLAVEDVDFLRKVVHVRRQVRIVRTRLCSPCLRAGKSATSRCRIGWHLRSPRIWPCTRLRRSPCPGRNPAASQSRRH
jgi:integrase